MYESTFRLTRRPFAAVPSPDNYYPAESIEEARTALVRLLERHEGPAMVVGPVGTGKTLLSRMLAEYFRNRCRVALIPSGRICTRRTLLQVILYELGLSYQNMEEGELRLSFIDHVTSRDFCPNGALILVDEADSLPMQLLDELRTMTNLVADGDPCIRLVLFGSSRLEEKFAHPRLESFNQRLAGRFYLEPLNRNETFEYIVTQFEDCGGDASLTFSNEALEAIYRATNGVPRLINQLADHALIIATANGVSFVDDHTVNAAWADLQQLPAPTIAATGPPIGADQIIEFGELDGGEFEEEKLPASTLDPMATIDEVQHQLDGLDDEEPSQASEIGSAVPPVQEDSVIAIDGSWDETSAHQTDQDAADWSDEAGTTDQTGDELTEPDQERADHEEVIEHAEQQPTEQQPTEQPFAEHTTGIDTDPSDPSATYRLPADQALSLHQAVDPFDDAFEYEEVVVNRWASANNLADRDNRQVTTTESQTFADAVDAFVDFSGNCHPHDNTLRLASEIPTEDVETIESWPVHGVDSDEQASAVEEESPRQPEDTAAISSDELNHAEERLLDESCGPCDLSPTSADESDAAAVQPLDDVIEAGHVIETGHADESVSSPSAEKEPDETVEGPAIPAPEETEHYGLHVFPEAETHVNGEVNAADELTRIEAECNEQSTAAPSVEEPSASDETTPLEPDLETDSIEADSDSDVESHGFEESIITETIAETHDHLSDIPAACVITGDASTDEFVVPNLTEADGVSIAVRDFPMFDDVPHVEPEADDKRQANTDAVDPDPTERDQTFVSSESNASDVEDSQTTGQAVLKDSITDEDEPFSSVNSVGDVGTVEPQSPDLPVHDQPVHDQSQPTGDTDDRVPGPSGTESSDDAVDKTGKEISKVKPAPATDRQPAKKRFGRLFSKMKKA